MARFLILFFLPLTIAVCALAQQKPAAQEPDLLLSVADNAKVVSWRDLRLQYTIVNGTSQAGIGVNSLTLSLPSSLAVTSSSLPRSTSGALMEYGCAFQMRAAGERRECPPIELRGMYLSEVRSRFFSLLTYRGQKESLVATLEYKPLDNPDAVLTKTAKLEFSVAPNPVGTYVGTLIGAFLIALLIPANHMAVQLTESGRVTLSKRLEMEQCLVRLVRGAIAGAIAALVLQTTADFSFPITVAVQDFYGGVLLGLMGDKVVEQILKKAGVQQGGRDSAANARGEHHQLA
jgi:hypothetical protein